LSGLSAAVPSPLYPGEKPVSNDFWFREQLWGERFQAGRTYTLPGELWIDFGWIGVVVGGFLFGRLSRRLLRLVSRPTSVFAPIVYSVAAVVFATLLFFVYQNGVANAELFAIPLLAAFILLGERSRRARERALALAEEAGR
jgi:oligosaccharide repeat unit polymerase